MRRQGAGRGAR